MNSNKSYYIYVSVLFFIFVINFICYQFLSLNNLDKSKALHLCSFRFEYRAPVIKFFLSKDSCFYAEALTYKDSNICDNVKDILMKKKCFTEVSKEPSFFRKIPLVKQMLRPSRWFSGIGRTNLNTVFVFSAFLSVFLYFVLIFFGRKKDIYWLYKNKGGR